MSATASWARSHKLELAWAVFALANFAVLVWLFNYQTVPFHFVWVSLTLLYGYRVWGMGVTLFVLACVCAASSVTLGYAVANGGTTIDELTEIPLMSAMFMVMVLFARRREAALAEARAAAEREREFVRDASHQLKTPIAVARGLAELLRDSEPRPDRRLDVADLVEELERLGDIAERLLLLEVAEQPDSLMRRPVEVEDLVVAAVRRWSYGAPRRWQVDIRADGLVDGDRQRLDAALDAVLENAVQATCERDEIRVTAVEDGAEAVVSVTDTGPGIPPDLLPRVFERFSRAGKDGTGLGLPIARAIVEAHGGRISARSGPGRGASIAIARPGYSPPAPAPAPPRHGAFTT
jgi:two-component system OmpR family sensor kinase